jgi:predicted RND superfamily exporter protein
MTNIIKWILEKRVSVLALLFCITVIFGYIASQGVFSSSFGKLFLGEDPEYQVYKQRIGQFANDEVIVIGFENPEILSKANQKRLRRVIKNIEKIPEIGRVESVLTAQKISSQDDTLFVKKYAKKVRRDNRLEVTKELAQDPFYDGLVISRDGQHAAVIIELGAKVEFKAEAGPAILEQIFSFFEQEGFERTKLHRAGLIATISEVVAQTQFNITHLFPIVCLVLLIVLFVMFNRLWPVGITLVVSLVAVIWTFGFSVLLDKNINVLVAMVPSVILIVATSDVIHICSAYMLELSKGSAKEEAIVTSSTEVGTACLMTSATTFVGFVSMSIVPVPVFRLMGLVLGFGVAVALLLAITLTPILFWMMKAPRPWNDQVSKVQGFLSKILKGVQRCSIRFPISVIVSFLALLAASIYGLTLLNIETNFGERLDEENQIRIDEKYFEKHFAGLNFLEVFIETSKEEGLLDPEAFKKISRFQDEIEKLPQVDKALSYVNLLRTIDETLNADERQLEKSPSRQLLSQYLLLFEMSGGEDLERLVDFDRKMMRLAVRLNTNAVRETYDIGQKVKEISTKITGEDIKVTPSGIVYLMGNFLDEIINGQRMGLMAAFVVIFILMVIWMRSLQIGLISMIPNLIPILALGGILGLFWDQVDSDVIAVAMIAIGIGVDDTIHFLVRLKFEAAKTNDTVGALKQTFHYTGRAIIITTIILGFGFLPFALSDYLSIRMMGILIPFTLVIALLADLFMVPAMAKVGLIDFRRSCH